MAAEASDKQTDEYVNIRPTTAGMTTKVVKGSLWTLAGQVAPLGVSLFTTPFTIRLLGAESYGVLILIGLIPTYLGFADFGMGMASTKFGSEAYAEGDAEKEARIVRTAALIALCSSVPVAAALIVFAAPVVGLFNVPESLRAEAALSLRLAAVTFVVNFLCGIFNTPQLAQLRMDLNTAVNTIPRILGLIATPIVIYLGYGIVGAVTVLLTASLLTLIGHSYVSGCLLPPLFDITIERDIFRLLLKFGGALALSAIAGVLLLNLEKAVLARTVSVTALAYYSVAFTLATMTTMFSASMVQSLIPAFSQLIGDANQERLENLFLTALRLNYLLILPLLAVLFAFARPMFAFWAGEDFGVMSTTPFYILIAGLFINLLAHVPYSRLIAHGRTDLFAKVYWMELIPYIALISILTSKYSATGAAIAWTIRTCFDSVILSFLLWKHDNVRFDFMGTKRLMFMLATALILVPFIVTLAAGGIGYAPLISVTVVIPIFVTFSIRFLLNSVEREYLAQRIRKILSVAPRAFQG